MSQSAAEQDATFSQEEVIAAEQIEQLALSKSQNQYLLRRVVALRAQLSRLEGEVDVLRSKIDMLEDNQKNVAT